MLETQAHSYCHFRLRFVSAYINKIFFIGPTALVGLLQFVSLDVSMNIRTQFDHLHKIAGAISAKVLGTNQFHVKACTKWKSHLKRLFLKKRYTAYIS